MDWENTYVQWNNIRVDRRIIVHHYRFLRSKHNILQSIIQAYNRYFHREFIILEKPYPSFRAKGNTKPPRQRSTWKQISRLDASSPSSWIQWVCKRKKVYLTARQLGKCQEKSLAANRNNIIKENTLKIPMNPVSHTSIGSIMPCGNPGADPTIWWKHEVVKTFGSTLQTNINEHCLIFLITPSLKWKKKSEKP